MADDQRSEFEIEFALGISSSCSIDNFLMHICWNLPSYSSSSYEDTRGDEIKAFA